MSSDFNHGAGGRVTLIFLKEACLSRHEVNIELNKSRFSLMSFVLLLPFVEHCKKKNFLFQCWEACASDRA